MGSPVLPLPLPLPVRLELLRPHDLLHALIRDPELARDVG
jgi:hypothetical protein